MARAYKAELVYTTFAEEVRQLAQQPWTRRDPILIACPKCGQRYSIVEQVDTADSDIERHKAAIIQNLERNCPVHPDKYREFD
jgi:hypothetical protein